MLNHILQSIRFRILTHSNWLILQTYILYVFFKYQILDDANPHLVAPSEWCCAPNSLGVGIYEAYLLGVLRLPLNVFTRELLYTLGIGPNQLNPNR